MAWTQIGGAAVSNTNSGTSVTSPSLNTTGASLLIIIVANGTALSSLTISDSNSNTWHVRADANFSGVHCGILYAWNKAGGALVTGAGHTVTVSTGTNLAIMFTAFSNGIVNQVDPYDGVVGENTGGSGPSTTCSTGSITPQVTSLVISAFGNGGTTGAAYGVAAPLTGGGAVSGVSGSTFGVGLGYSLSGINTAVSAVWTSTVSGTNGATIASFLLSPSPAPTTLYQSDVLAVTDGIITNPYVTDTLHLSDAVFISLNYQASISNDQFKFADFEIGQWTGTPPIFSDSETLTDDAQATLTFTGGTLAFLDASITIIVPGDGLSLSDSPGNLFSTFIIGNTESPSDQLLLSDGIQSWDGVSKGGMTDNFIYGDSVNLTIGSLQDNYLRRYLGDVGGT